MPQSSPGSPILRFGCHGQRGNQHFQPEWISGVDTNPMLIKHVPSGTCVTADLGQQRVYLGLCNRANVAQHWSWDVLQWKRAKKHEKTLNLEP